MKRPLAMDHLVMDSIVVADALPRYSRERLALVRLADSARLAIKYVEALERIDFARTQSHEDPLAAFAEVCEIAREALA